MRACITKDGRELFYVEVEGVRKEDYGFYKFLCKTRENALKRAEVIIKKHNEEYSFIPIKVTGRVLNSIEMSKFKKGEKQ